MQQQLIIVLLVGLAVSAYGLDLSHAAKRSTDLEPRVASLIGNLYAQAISPPLTHAVTNLAHLTAQAIANIRQNGIHTRDGRTLHLSEDELRGFFSGLWNDALKPPIENALTGLSLLAAQLLAGIGSNGVNLGIGKRDLTEAEMRGFFDSLSQAVNDVFSNVLQKPLEDAISGGALMLAQVLAGLGTNGVNLSNLLGKRDLTEAESQRFLDILNQAINDVFSNVFQKPLEDAISGGALMLAQVLAGLGTNGVNLSNLFGKRDLTEAEMRGFFDSLSQAVNDVFSNVLQKPLEDAISGGALMLAQVLAGLGTNGVNLSNLLGKRDLTEAEMRGFFDSLSQAVNDVFSNVLQKPLEDAISGGALMLAQVLAGLGTNGVNLSNLLGKRDLTEAESQRFLDILNQAINDVFSNVFQKPLEDAISGGALMLAQVLAGLGTNGVNLSNLFGKRDLTEAESQRFLDILNQAINDVFSNVFQKPLEDAISGGALMLAQVLAGLGTNGVNLSNLFGKRDLSDLAGREEELRGIFGTVSGAVVNGLTGVWNNIFQVPLENFVQNSALTAAGWLANFSQTGLGRR